MPRKKHRHYFNFDELKNGNVRFYPCECGITVIAVMVEEGWTVEDDED